MQHRCNELLRDLSWRCTCAFWQDEANTLATETTPWTTQTWRSLQRRRHIWHYFWPDSASSSGLGSSTCPHYTTICAILLSPLGGGHASNGEVGTSLGTTWCGITSRHGKQSGSCVLKYAPRPFIGIHDWPILGQTPPLQPEGAPVSSDMCYAEMCWNVLWVSLLIV